MNPENDPRYRDYWETYHGLMARRGVSPDIARAIMRTNTTAIGAVMVHRGEADSLICGTFGQYSWHLNYVRQVLARDGLHPVGALSMMILEEGPLFIADTQVPQRPHAPSDDGGRDGRRPPCPPLWHGPQDRACAAIRNSAIPTVPRGARCARRWSCWTRMSPISCYEGEMHVDAALDPELRERIFPQLASGRRRQRADLCQAPMRPRASGTSLKMKGGGLEVGPILMGMGNRAHIVTPSITARGLLNMASMAGTPVTHYG